MLTQQWSAVPVGIDAHRWVTRDGCQPVLGVVHSIASGQQVLEVLELIEPDTRVQVVYTVGPDVFNAGVEEFLRAQGALVIPWEQAVREHFALAVTASYGEIYRLHAPVLVLPHGAGYGKRVRADPGPASDAAVYGLDAQRLMRDGKVVPAAIALSHERQRTTLSAQCPPAAEHATVIGDVCFDRLLASAGHRAKYRTALGVGAGEYLVVAASTWGAGAQFAEAGLLPWLLDQLDARTHRVAALLHPAIWFGHGERQVRAWLRDCADAGLIVVHAQEDWRAVLIAADLIVGDHGSSTVYGAALGVPVLHTSSGLRDLNAESPQALLARAAPRLTRSVPLAEQLGAARERAASWRIPVREALTSRPGEAFRLVREQMYRLLGLDVPGRHRVPEPVAIPRLPDGGCRSWPSR